MACRSKANVSGDTFTVSGPDVARDGIPGAGAALSYAQGQAARAARPVTLYVRDAEGATVYRVERDDARVVRTVRP